MSTATIMETSAAPRTPSSVKVFRIPELVRALVTGGNIERGDIVSLSQASRPTFEALVPLIWMGVCGVEILLSLITSTSLVYDESTGDLKEVKLKKQSRCNQFKRFDIYAPFVQFLDVYGHNRPAFRVSGWRLLNSRTQSRVLLPNLETLYVSCRIFPGRSADTPMWVRLFSNTNLRTVSICASRYSWCTHYPWAISPSSMSIILSALADKSSHLQTLFIPPRDRSISVAPRLQSASKARKPWHDHLKHLPALRHATIGDGWVTHPALIALGQLPGLESLDLYMEYFEGLNVSSDDHGSLRAGSFATLRKLQLNNVYRFDVLDLMGLRELLANVVDLQIHQAPFLAEYRDRFTTQLLPLLANAPNLQWLYIESDIADFDLPSNIGMPAIMNVMSQLPLQQVHLEMMHLGTGPLKFDLGIVWPNVTSLSLPAQYASLQELSYFAAMPLLHHLNVRLDMMTMHVPKNIPTNHSHLQRFESSPGAKLPQNFDTMMHNVRTIQVLFPGIVLVHWSEADRERPIFKNLATNFNCLLIIHYHLTPRVLEESGGEKANKARICNWNMQLERYREAVDTGTDMFQHLSDCDCSDCASDLNELSD